MKIQLEENEITLAVKAHLTEQGINLAGKTVTIEYRAGRGDNGTTAEVNIDSSPLPDFFAADEAAAAAISTAAGKGTPAAKPATVLKAVANKVEQKPVEAKPNGVFEGVEKGATAEEQSDPDAAAAKKVADPFADGEAKAESLASAKGASLFS